jgi:hypothetical protein
VRAKNRSPRPLDMRGFFLAVTAVVASMSASNLACPLFAATSDAHLVAPSRYFDFGRVKKGERISHCFEIGNDGGAALHISGMSMSYSGMSARVSASIAPKKSARLCIGLDTSALDLDVNARTSIALDDPTQPHVAFLLHGYVSEPIDLIPMSAVFASVFQGEGAERHISIVNNQDQPLEIRAIEKQGPHFDADIAVREPGRVFDFIARIDPATPPGRYTELAYLLSDPGFPRIRIAINIFVKTEVYAIPSSVDFGILDRARFGGFAGARGGTD